MLFQGSTKPESSLLKLHRAKLATDVTVAHLAVAVADRVGLAGLGVPPPDLRPFEVAGDAVLLLLVVLNHAVHLELKTLLLRLLARTELGLLHDFVLELLLQLGLPLGELVVHVLVRLLLVLVDDLLPDLLLQEGNLFVLLELATLVGFELVLALVDHGLLLVEPVLSDQHLRLELLLLAHSAEFETAVGLVAEEVVGHVGEDAVVVVDREVQLGVRSPLLRLGNVFLLENLVLAFTEGSDC